MRSKITTVLRRISYFIVLLPLALLYQKLNIVHSAHLISVSTVIDKQIPFVAAFVVPYVSWYFYIGLGSFLLSSRKNLDYYKYLSCLILGWAVCCLCFYFYPVKLIRPEIYANDTFSQAVKFLYTIDGCFNCLPSTHVLAAVLVTLFLCRYYKSIYIRSFSVTWCIMICVSTLFIKQHYFFDVISAILLSLILFISLTPCMVPAWARQSTMHETGRMS